MLGFGFVWVSPHKWSVVNTVSGYSADLLKLTSVDCSNNFAEPTIFLFAAMFFLAQFRWLLGEFRLSSSVACYGVQECVCGSNVQIFRVVAVFVLGNKLQYNWFSKFYLVRLFFFNHSCFQKIIETKYLEFIKTYLLLFRLELCVKVNCMMEKYA